MRIIFTGQSGQNIDYSLSKFIDEYQGFKFVPSKKPRYFKVENYIERIYKEKKNINVDSIRIWKRFLRETYILQQQIWIEAFEKILSEINSIESEHPDSNIFINLHAVYFHPRTQEYLSFLKIDLIKQFNPNIFITLIDDIFDIRLRLAKSPDDIFYDKIHEDINSQQLTIANQLQRVLDWRAKEIMMSKFVAKEVTSITKHILFAIKHPWNILYNLLLSDKPTVYLSHPISEPRRLENRGEYEKSSKIREEITSLSNKLCENFVTFLPTTIDEFRIKKERKGSIHVFNPSLGRRWEQSLYEKGENMLYVDSGFKDKDVLWQEEGVLFDSQLNFVLQNLNNMISNQVTSRDYMLVEQSDILVVYRPLYNGNASGGVKEENDYYEDLNRSTEIIGRSKNNFKFIYSTPSDILLYTKNSFNSVLQKYLKHGDFTYREPHVFDSISDEEFILLLEARNVETLLLDFLKVIYQNHKIQIRSDPDDPIDAISPLNDIDSNTTKIELRFIGDYLQKVGIIDIYRGMATVFFEAEIFDIQHFINIIKE